MIEVVKFSKEEKRLRKDLKDISGIDKKDPLPPEFIRDTYTGAYDVDKSLRRIANSTEAQAETYDKEKDKKLARRDAKRYRKDGRVALEKTVKAAAKYVNENNGFYYEQAKAEDLQSPKELKIRNDEFASTLEEIEDLPEYLDGPNN